MQLYLLRHADAEPALTSDAARRLTSKGEAQAAKVAAFCREKGIAPEIIVTSPYTRARETAAIVAAALGVELLEAPFLASGASPETIMGGIGEFARFESVLMVGHEPDLSLLTSSLIGAEGGFAVEVRKATLLGLSLRAPGVGLATLDFLAPVAML